MKQVTQYRIKVRHRLHPPKPWKWEIYDGERQVMGSSESYASYHEAHGAAQTALDRLTLGAMEKE